MTVEEIKRGSVVYPESTIESANQRKFFRKDQGKSSIPTLTVTSNTGGSSRGSTPDSSNRRNFLRKAALATAVVGVGSTFLSEKLLIKSSAKSDTPVDGYCPTCAGVCGESCSGYGVAGMSCCGAGVFGTSETGIGVCGTSCLGNGVVGNSSAKIAVLGRSKTGVGSLGVTESVVPSPPGKIGVYGVANTGCGVYGRSASGRGIFGHSCSNIAVFGHAQTSGCGVLGESCSGPGVKGTSTSSSGVLGSSSTGFGVQAESGTATAIPIVAKGVAGQTANLQQWVKGCTPLSVVNKCGWLGLGTAAPGTTLQVNGSLSAKVTIATSSYSMSALDFGVLANATSAALTVTLPAASTALGMIVFVKKIDSSTNKVTVAASGTDKIEGKSSESLSKQYESYTLVSDGSANWYVISNDTK